MKLNLSPKIFVFNLDTSEDFPIGDILPNKRDVEILHGYNIYKARTMLVQRPDLEDALNRMVKYFQENVRKQVEISICPVIDEEGNSGQALHTIVVNKGE